MLSLEIESKRVRSFDGTELVYHTTAGQGPWVVLFNGLGARLSTWRHQLSYLKDHCRFLSWEYRGLHEPDAASPPASSASLLTHAQDLLAVLQAESVPKSIWMGWGMGVHVLLEALELQPERCSHIVLINGTYQDAAHRSSARWLAPYAFGAVHKTKPALESLLRRTASWPETVSWLKRFHLVGPTIDEEALTDAVTDYGQLNVSCYLQNLEAVERHNTDALLRSIQVPALVIVGQNDPFIPRDQAEAAARMIPGAELFTIRGAKHHAPLEFPELVNLRVEKFFREHGI